MLNGQFGNQIKAFLIMFKTQKFKTLDLRKDGCQVYQYKSKHCNLVKIKRRPKKDALVIDKRLKIVIIETKSEF